MISFNEIVMINRAARFGAVRAPEMAWFRSQKFDKKREILKSIAVMIGEAHATTDDVNVAISQAGLRKTFTPCVMMLSGPLLKQASAVARLGESEMDKSFRLFVSILSVADERRRSRECGSGCSHWWHLDLLDDAVVDELLSERGRH